MTRRQEGRASRGHKKGESRLTRLTRLTTVSVPWPPAWLVGAAAGPDVKVNEGSLRTVAGGNHTVAIGVASGTEDNLRATVASGDSTSDTPLATVGSGNGKAASDAGANDTFLVTLSGNDETLVAGDGGTKDTVLATAANGNDTLGGDAVLNDTQPVTVAAGSSTTDTVLATVAGDEDTAAGNGGTDDTRMVSTERPPCDSSSGSGNGLRWE
jgi:hypothetical protein